MNEWFNALERKANLDNHKPWYCDHDYVIAGLFIVFLALCAADLV